MTTFRRRPQQTSRILHQMRGLIIFLFSQAIVPRRGECPSSDMNPYSNSQALRTGTRATRIIILPTMLDILRLSHSRPRMTQLNQRICTRFPPRINGVQATSSMMSFPVTWIHQPCFLNTGATKGQNATCSREWVTHVLALHSTSGYHCASNTLQVEESHGMVASQPPPPLNSATGTCPILPFPQPYSPDSSRCQRRACGSQNVRYHPASVPQHLPRGTRKNWGPAATKMNLESTIAELCREGVDDEAINTVKEIFGTGFNVGALMRKMTKEESWRYLNGEKGQIYRALLRDVKERFQCRLCHEGPHAMSWKHARDVVRHLRRDHFGLGDSCAYWFVLPTLGPI